MGFPTPTTVVVKETIPHKIDLPIPEGEQYFSPPSHQRYLPANNLGDKALVLPRDSEYQRRVVMMCITLYVRALKFGYNEQDAMDLAIHTLKYIVKNRGNLDGESSPGQEGLRKEIPREENKFQPQSPSWGLREISPEKKEAILPSLEKPKHASGENSLSLISDKNLRPLKKIDELLKTPQRILSLSQQIKKVSRKIAGGVHSLLELLVTAMIVPFTLLRMKKKGRGSRKFIERTWEAIRATYDKVKKNPVMQTINILLNIIIFALFIIQSINPLLIPLPASLVSVAAAIELMTTLAPVFYQGCKKTSELSDEPTPRLLTV